VSTPKKGQNFESKYEIEVICANAVERAHTKFLDANDKLRQTRPHVRNTIASRETAIRNAKSSIHYTGIAKLLNIETQRQQYLQQNTSAKSES